MKRKEICDSKFWNDTGDESLKLIDFYGRKYCRRFKVKESCGCGCHSAGDKNLNHHAHYMRYSVRLMRHYVWKKKNKY